MIQRFLVCGQTLPQSTVVYRYAARKMESSPRRKKKWMGGMIRLSKLKGKANLFFCRNCGPRRGYGRTARITASGLSET